MEKSTAELRAQVLEAYGGMCALCSEDDPDLLHIDHVRGGGTKERKSIRGKRFYAMVIRQGFPDLYRLLCVACHTKVTIGQSVSPHSGMGQRAPAVVTRRDTAPEAQECREVAAVLQGVLSRMEAIEGQSRPLTLDDNRALPALRSGLPVFESPSLCEAWKLQTAAIEFAHREIDTAQRQLMERLVSRLMLILGGMAIAAGTVGLFTFGRWVLATI